MNCKALLEVDRTREVENFDKNCEALSEVNRTRELENFDKNFKAIWGVDRARESWRAFLRIAKLFWR